MKKIKKAFRDTTETSPILAEMGITTDMTDEQIKTKFLEWMKREYIKSYKKIMQSD